MSREVLLPVLRGLDKEERKASENDGIHMNHRRCFRWDGHTDMGHVHHWTIVIQWHQVHLTLLSAQFDEYLEERESLTPLCAYTHGVMTLTHTHTHTPDTHTRAHTRTQNIHTDTQHKHTDTHTNTNTHTYTPDSGHSGMKCEVLCSHEHPAQG